MDWNERLNDREREGEETKRAHSLSAEERSTEKRQTGIGLMVVVLNGERGEECTLTSDTHN